MQGLEHTTGGHDEPKITERDLIKYVAGAELDPDLWTAINGEVKKIGSPIQKWVAKLRATDPLDVDWGAIASYPDDDAG